MRTIYVALAAACLALSVVNFWFVLDGSGSILNQLAVVIAAGSAGFNLRGAMDAD